MDHVHPTAAVKIAPWDWFVRKVADWMDVLGFDDLLNIEPPKGPRHLLLGNGFSIAAKPDIFRYGALFDRADFSGLCPEVKDAFEVLETTDFEDVMRALREASKLLKLYSPKDEKLAKQLSGNAESLKEILVTAIAGSHPAGPFEIDTPMYESCRRFLSHFKHIYSVNYDLLLYWAFMQDLQPPLTFDDGFRTPGSGSEDYVTWEVENTNEQNVFYLHGALHIFDAEHEIKKYTWANTGIPLIEQIRDALDQDMFPLVVAEGTSDQKLAHINHSNYLSRNYRSLLSIGGQLFVFGLSMSDNDEHILKLVEKNKVRSLCVGLFGDPSGESNKELEARVERIAASRPAKRPLQIEFFDSESAKVWG